MYYKLTYTKDKTFREVIMTANYSKDIIRQLEEQTRKADNLEKENKNLRSEVKYLRKQLSDFEENINKRISDAIEKAIVPLKEEISVKNDELIKANTEISRLKAVINKDSGNSSKPPSTNGYKKVSNSREKTGNLPGGKKGHEGRRLSKPKNLDELVEKGLAEVRVVDHTNGNAEYVSRWVADIEVKTIFTEHRFPTESELPKEYMNEITYGTNIKAICTLLSVEGIIARERLAEFFNQITNGILTPAEATLGEFINQVAKGLDKEVDVIKNTLLNGEVMHVDETPMKCSQTLEYNESEEEPTLRTAQKSTYNVTVRNYSNAQATLYTVNPKKNIEGIERDGILPTFIGTLSHDHDKKLYNYGTNHSTCGAHLVRELKGLNELYNSSWADDMRHFMLQLNEHKNHDLNLGQTECNPAMLQLYVKWYDELVQAGEDELKKNESGGFGEKEISKMIKRLRNYKENYVLFIKNYKVPFTNNLSERDLRPCKTKQKVSGCFRSWSGIKTYTTVRSFVSTVKKRGLNLLNSIKNIFEGTPVLE